MSSQTPLRTARRMASDVRRGQLLEAGLKLFSIKPFDEVSVDDIAAATGTARGLLYHYFGSKRGLYMEVVRSSADDLIAQLQPDPDLDPLENLLGGLGRALAWIREHSEGYLAVLTVSQGPDEEIATEVDRVRTAIGDLVLANVAVPPELRSLALAHVRGWVGYVEGLIPAWLDDEITGDALLSLASTTLYSWFTGTDGIDVPDLTT